MGWFRRRPAGRHALPVRREVAPAPPAAAAPPAPAVPAQVAVPPQAAVPAWEQPGWSPPELPPAPRVELGFRDGTTAALAPDSAQARALTAIAEVLTRKD